MVHGFPFFFNELLLVKISGGSPASAFFFGFLCTYLSIPEARIENHACVETKSNCQGFLLNAAERRRGFLFFMEKCGFKDTTNLLSAIHAKKSHGTSSMSSSGMISLQCIPYPRVEGKHILWKQLHVKLSDIPG